LCTDKGQRRTHRRCPTKEDGQGITRSRSRHSDSRCCHGALATMRNGKVSDTRAADAVPNEDGTKALETAKQMIQTRRTGMPTHQRRRRIL
ncbi:hypothetical protein LSAT2_020940, partial [Lamellibrachia satsuma]